MPKRNGRKTSGRGRGIWSGTVTFGLVSVPVELHPGARQTQVAFRLLDADGTPVNRRYACSTDNKALKSEEIVRGYEVADDEFVVVTDDELEALAPEKSRDIELQRFVRVEEIDLVFFDHPYLLLPAGGSSKAYALLTATMERAGRAGIATFVMRDHEYLIAILAEGGVLRAETLRFADEVRDPARIGLTARGKAAPRDVTRFGKAIRQLAVRQLDAGDLVNERDRRLVQLIAEKDKQGRDVVKRRTTLEEGEHTVLDLMERLKQSLPPPRKRAA